MKIAIMIPMDRAAMADGALYPTAWGTDGGGVFGIQFPELDGGVPRLDEETAAHVREEIEGFAAIGHTRMVIETRSEAAFSRVRRMVAERDDIEADVYLVRGEEQERHEINRYGAISPWPLGLFEHTLAELHAVTRAGGERRRREGQR